MTETDLPGRVELKMILCNAAYFDLNRDRCEYRIRIDGVEQIESFEVVATDGWPAG